MEIKIDFETGLAIICILGVIFIGIIRIIGFIRSIK